MEAATKKICASLKDVEGATERGARLTAAKRCFRALHELRVAVREQPTLAQLRDGAAQAQAWDARSRQRTTRGLAILNSGGV